MKHLTEQINDKKSEIIKSIRYLRGEEKRLRKELKARDEEIERLQAVSQDIKLLNNR